MEILGYLKNYLLCLCLSCLGFIKWLWVGFFGFSSIVLDKNVEIEKLEYLGFRFGFILKWSFSFLLWVRSFLIFGFV